MPLGIIKKKKLNCALYQLNYDYLNYDDKLSGGGMLFKRHTVYIIFSVNFLVTIYKVRSLVDGWNTIVG